MRLSPLFLSLALVLSIAAPVTNMSGAAFAAGNQSNPPPTDGNGGRDCEHEKKEQQTS